MYVCHKYMCVCVYTDINYNINIFVYTYAVYLCEIGKENYHAFTSIKNSGISILKQ